LSRQRDTCACDKSRRAVKQKVIIITTTTTTETLIMKDVRLNKNTREWDNIIITTVYERALPGTKLTETTNDRLPSRTTDTESDYQNSE